MQAASERPSLDQLKEKYFQNGLLNSREGTGKRRCSTDKRASISRSTANSRRLSSQNTNIFPNRQSFRDIVLKAAEHKPFLERLNSSSRNRLTGMGHQARLDKFRQIASRWQNKAKINRRIETLPEVDYDVEMPEKPRFCATLSAEAQYAIFKGYEDVLVDKISSSLTTDKNIVDIKRIPSAVGKPKTDSDRCSLPILENQPNIVLVASPKAKEAAGNNDTEDATSARLKRDRDQRYMSAHFKQGMNILDELKRHNAIEPSAGLNPADSNGVILQNSIYKQYHSWSQQWAKHFEFSC